MAFSAPISKSTGDLVSASDWNTNTVDNVNALLPIGIAIIYDGGGTEIADNVQLWTEVVPKCDIERVTLLADQSGSIVIDLWVDSYANWPPTDADSITAAAPPTISAATKSQDSTLSGWTKAISAGDAILGNVDSCTDIEKVACCLKLSRS